VAVLGCVAALTLSACTKSKTPAPIDTTVTQTVTGTRTTTAPGKAITFSFAAQLPPGAGPAKGELEKPCPYIASSPDQNPNVNVADIEGDHVYRTTQLVDMKPVGCRFYFYAGPYEPVADITTYRFASAAEATTSLSLTARKDAEAFTKSLGHGITGVLFRAKLNPEDGGNDWACGFVKGNLVIVVRTRQNVSFNAGEIAKAIVTKF
jgi:hypothetical protein